MQHLKSIYLPIKDILNSFLRCFNIIVLHEQIHSLKNRVRRLSKKCLNRSCSNRSKFKGSRWIFELKNRGQIDRLFLVTSLHKKGRYMLDILNTKKRTHLANPFESSIYYQRSQSDTRLHDSIEKTRRQSSVYVSVEIWVQRTRLSNTLKHSSLP